MERNPRYDRHYSLPGFGMEAQEKLGAAKVLVIGAGGLGCPVLQYLTASGVGYIGVLDFDIIQLSNLQRQTLYSTADVGQLKSRVAVKQLRANNPTIKIVEHAVQLNSDNARAILELYDIVVDCTDNFTIRYILNDCCVTLQKPLVFAAIYQYEGQIAVFNIPNEQGIACNYRDLFPEIPRADEALNCSENGVLGILPGIIGLMQATEVTKLITGIGETLSNKLMTFNVLNYQSMIIEITHDLKLQIRDFESLADQSAAIIVNQELGPGDAIPEIQPNEIPAYLNDPDVSVLDIRERHEEPQLPIADQKIPLSVLYERMDELTATHIIVVCQSGKRSIHAAQKLKAHFGNKRKISHLAGGIISYFNSNKPE